MSTTIDQKAYLQKYLGGEKKKKKKKVVKGKGLKIIDDDIDLSKLRPLEGDEVDILGEGEDAPQIAGIIDERPEEVKKLEQFKTSSKWRVINQDDGFSSKLSIEEIKKDIKEVEKENELVFGKMYSDSEDEKRDSDPSPPRQPTATTDKSKKHSSNSETSRKISEPKHNSDSDVSPPRKGSTKNRNSNRDGNYDSDLSPPRKNNQSSTSKERARKPSRWGEADRRSSHSPKKLQKRVSSPRKSRNDSDASPPRKSSKIHSEASLPKRKEIYKRSNDSDLSPIRGSKKEERTRSDSDPSPPRKKQSPGRSKNRSKDKHTKNKHGGQSRPSNSSDSDLSPPRKKSNKSQRSSSPHRKSRKRSPERNTRKQDSDSDLSPPRKNQSRSDDRTRRNSDSPPPTNKKMASRTLEGKKAGLQDATQLREENEEFRRREEEAFRKLADEVSGRTATAVSRKSKRETSEERRKQKEKTERQKDLDEKYKKWSKGIKQLEAQEARVQDFLHESSKPLARHRGDRDLESSLKQVERAGDPMLQYIRERKRERGEMPPEKPTFKGNFPPNRFNIRPGYRWDGVDRSNGYEKKYFETQSKKKAMEEEAYKWSTEDL